MAKVLGLGLTNFKGSLGKVVYRNSIYGNVASEKAASVSNPKTLPQQKQRALTKTNSLAYSALQGVVNHSFENITTGARSMNEFLRLNAAMLKNRKVSFNAKNNTSIAPSPWIVSTGTLNKYATYESVLFFSMYDETDKIYANRFEWLRSIYVDLPFADGEGEVYFFGLSPDVDRAIGDYMDDTSDDREAVRTQWAQVFGALPGQQITLVLLCGQTTADGFVNYSIDGTEFHQKSLWPEVYRFIIPSTYEGAIFEEVESHIIKFTDDFITASNAALVKNNVTTAALSRLRFTNAASGGENGVALLPFMNISGVDDLSGYDYLSVCAAATIISEKEGSTWKRNNAQMAVSMTNAAASIAAGVGTNSELYGNRAWNIENAVQTYDPSSELLLNSANNG